MFKGLIVGILVGVLLVFAGVYFYFTSGMAPVATAEPPMPFEKKLAHAALAARIDKAKPQDPLAPADEKSFLAGAEVYKQNCAVCHGLPGEEQSTIALGMFPNPPHLFKGTGVTDDPAFETYWKAENGIRMTGMPAFKGKLTELQIWQVSQLLANADKIPASVKTALTTTTTTAQADPAPAAVPAKAPPAKK